MITLRILRWEGYLGLSRWVRCEHKGLCNRGVGESESDSWLCDSGGRNRVMVFEDGAGDQKVRIASRIASRSCRGQGNAFSYRASLVAQGVKNLLVMQET